MWLAMPFEPAPNELRDLHAVVIRRNNHAQAVDNFRLPVAATTGKRRGLGDHSSCRADLSERP